MPAIFSGSKAETGAAGHDNKGESSCSSTLKRLTECGVLTCPSDSRVTVGEGSEREETSPGFPSAPSLLPFQLLSSPPPPGPGSRLLPQPPTTPTWQRFPGPVPGASASFVCPSLHHSGLLHPGTDLTQPAWASPAGSARLCLASPPLDGAMFGQRREKCPHRKRAAPCYRRAKGRPEESGSGRSHFGEGHGEPGRGAGVPPPQSFIRSTEPRKPASGHLCKGGGERKAPCWERAS